MHVGNIHMQSKIDVNIVECLCNVNVYMSLFCYTHFDVILIACHPVFTETHYL